MAFTLFWKIFVLVYLVITFLLRSKIIRYATDDEENIVIKKQFIKNNARFISCLILNILWFVMTLVFIFKVLYTPSSEYITKTKLVYEKVYIYEGDEYSEDEWEEYWEERQNEDDEDWTNYIW